MRYKNTLLAIILTLFLIPSVALASWWNPISWFSNWDFLFNKRNNQEEEVETLKERINELEKMVVEDDSVIEETIPEEQEESVNSSKQNQSSYSSNSNIQTTNTPTINTPTTNTSTFTAKQEQTNQKNNNLSLLKNYLNDEFSEKIKEAEEESERILDDWNDFQKELEPLDKKMDDLLDDMKTECPSGEFRTGASAQNCLQISADMQVLSAEMQSMLYDYQIETGTYSTSRPTSRNELNENVFTGLNYYKLYYDGSGNGTIYNSADVTDNYNFYCKNGACDIFGF